jgi:hypothetical protein
MTYSSGEPIPPGVYQVLTIIKTSLVIESELLNIEVQGYEQDIPLYKGWNFISLPCVPLDSSIFNILRFVFPYYKAIWTYDSKTDSWLKYVTGNDYYYNDLRTMEYGKGYLIEVSQDVILSIMGRFIEDTKVYLKPGLNFVGFNSTSSLPIYEALSSVNYKSILAYKHDDLAEKWVSQLSEAPAFFNNLSNLEPGKGYCIYVDTACLWEIK